MRDIATINQRLLKSEFDMAKAIYEQARGAGHGALSAAAIVYRHGYMDGKESQMSRTKEAYKKLYAEKNAARIEESQPMANTEGEQDNE